MIKFYKRSQDTQHKGERTIIENFMLSKIKTASGRMDKKESNKNKNHNIDSSVSVFLNTNTKVHTQNIKIEIVNPEGTR